jgi:hypothetical protein
MWRSPGRDNAEPYRNVLNDFRQGRHTGLSAASASDGGTVSRSYATGAVAGSNYVGGLVGQTFGRTDNFGNIDNSYATGSVTGSQHVGGLVGGSYGYLATNNSANISNSYSTGSVTSPGPGFGGLVGNETPSTGTNSAVTTNSFWDITKSGQTTSAGGIGLTTAQLQDPANFTSATPANGNVNPGWNFVATWVMYSGHTDPLLQVFMTPLTVITTLAQTYDGAAFAPTISNLDYSIAPDFSHLFGTLTVTGTAVGAIHAGSYTYTPGGLYSDQQGYIIAPYVTGTLTINPASLTVTGTMAANKVYDGTTSALLTGGTLVGILGSDSVTLAQAGTFASKNVGSGIAVSASDSISGANDGDYTLVEPTGVTGTITPAPLTVSGTTVSSKVYDGTTVAALIGGSLVGVVGGDTVTLNQSGVFASASAGNGIAVTATDSLRGPSAGDYSLLEPTGLTGSILSASPPGGSSGLGLDALNAETQVVENFIYPQLGANPQAIDASPTIAVLDTSADDASADRTGSQKPIAVNVSMKIGANGTLKIENGGLRLPRNLAVGNE